MQGKSSEANSNFGLPSLSLTGHPKRFDQPLTSFFPPSMKPLLIKAMCQRAKPMFVIFESVCRYFMVLWVASTPIILKFATNL